MAERGGVRNAIENRPVWALVAAILALHVLLTVWQTWASQINDDGILYVRAARLFLDGQFAEAKSVYGWFAFPLLIAAVSKITTLEALVAGKLINVVASVVTLSLLLHMCWTQTRSRVALCTVAVLIFGNYAWNDARGAVTRDHLFFCFVILSFFFLLRDRGTSFFPNKFGFALSCLCASLFRKEAAALLVMVPALLVTFSAYPRPIRIAAAASFVFTGVVAIFWVAYQGSGYDLHALLAGPTNRIAVLSDQVLAPFASRRALLAYSSMITGLIVVSMIASLSWLSLALVGWGCWRSFAFRHQRFLRIYACYLVASLVSLSAQTYFLLVFEPRYGLTLGLLLTIPAAVAATTLVPVPARANRRAWLAVVLASAWLLYGLVGGLKFSDSSSFHFNAARWLRENVARDAVSLSNSNQISFYGDLSYKDADPDFLIRSTSGRDDISKLRTWSKYDVVVVRLRQSQLGQIAGLTAAIGKPPSQEFVNSRGDTIVIYQPRKP